MHITLTNLHQVYEWVPSRVQFIHPFEFGKKLLPHGMDRMIQ